MFLTNICLKNCNKKIGHHACLRDMMGQTYPFMPVLVPIMRVIHQFRVHFAAARSKIF